jgi:hypothetical protein
VRERNSNLKGLKYKISAEDDVKIKDAGHSQNGAAPDF